MCSSIPNNEFPTFDGTDISQYRNRMTEENSDLGEGVSTDLSFEEFWGQFEKDLMQIFQEENSPHITRSKDYSRVHDNKYFIMNPLCKTTPSFCRLKSRVLKLLGPPFQQKLISIFPEDVFDRTEKKSLVILYNKINANPDLEAHLNTYLNTIEEATK